MTPRRNLEIKARCSDLAVARQTARALCGDTGTIEQQCDTYFRVPRGRLKLREIAGQPAVLIAYHRPNDVSARTSEYHLVPVADAAALKAALTATLGVRGAVRKRREIFLHRNVRIHLDTVDGLGDFIEFEAVLGDDDAAEDSQALLKELGQRFHLDLTQLLAPSYSDLLGI